MNNHPSPANQVSRAFGTLPIRGAEFSIEFLRAFIESLPTIDKVKYSEQDGVDAVGAWCAS